MVLSLLLLTLLMFISHSSSRIFNFCCWWCQCNCSVDNLQVILYDIHLVVVNLVVVAVIRIIVVVSHILLLLLTLLTIVGNEND